MPAMAPTGSRVGEVPDAAGKLEGVKASRYWAVGTDTERDERLSRVGLPARGGV